MGKDSFVAIAVVVLTRLTTWVKTQKQDSWWDGKDLEEPHEWAFREEDLHSSMQVKNTDLYFTPGGGKKIALDLLKKFGSKS